MSMKVKIRQKYWCFLPKESFKRIGWFRPVEPWLGRLDEVPESNGKVVELRKLAKWDDNLSMFGDTTLIWEHEAHKFLFKTEEQAIAAYIEAERLNIEEAAEDLLKRLKALEEYSLKANA